MQSVLIAFIKKIDFFPPLSEEDKALLYKDMPKLWANPYTRALILLEVAETHPHALATLVDQKDTLIFDPNTIDAAFKNTQNPTPYQYVLAATLALIQKGDLPALGKFVDPAEAQRQEIQQRVIAHNTSQTDETTKIILPTVSKEEKEEKPEIPPLDNQYKVPLGTYSPYNLALQVLRSNPSKTLTDAEIEKIVDEKPHRKNQILEVLAPIAKNKNAWNEDGTLQPMPLTKRLTQGDIAGFISYACVLLGLKSQEDQEQYAAVVAQQMGYEVGHTFKKDDLTFVQSGYQQNFGRFLSESNILWQGGATPNFTQTTLATLYPMLFDSTGQPTNPKTTDTWGQIVELLNYKPRTAQQYVRNPQPNRLGPDYSARLAEVIDRYTTSGALTPTQIDDLYKTVYREGVMEY